MTPSNSGKYVPHTKNYKLLFMDHYTSEATITGLMFEELLILLFLMSTYLDFNIKTSQVSIELNKSTVFTLSHLSNTKNLVKS